MRRLTLIALSASLLFVSLLSGLGASPASAASTSSGCAYINANAGHTLIDFFVTGYTFNAGDIITETITTPQADLLIFVGVFTPGGIVAGTPLALTNSVSWTVPSTQTIPQMDITYGSYNSNGYVTVSCTPRAGTIHRWSPERFRCR